MSETSAEDIDPHNGHFQGWLSVLTHIQLEENTWCVCVWIFS